MSVTELSMSWDSHKKNICDGLSHLQQCGEFVDMTLAADGHLVKVHQMVLALVSPYLKELISSAPCPHPVIFLNNITYTTLCAILEYVYMGEVHVKSDHIKDLIVAGRALHIKGLKDMDIPESNPLANIEISKDQDNYADTNPENHNKNDEKDPKKSNSSMCKVDAGDAYNEDTDLPMVDLSDSVDSSNTKEDKSNDGGKRRRASIVQYTISNMGSLQLVFNRYIYRLRYVQKNLNRVWRCTNNEKGKCFARVITNNRNEVVERSCSHNHPFHDAKILQKLRRGLIYSAIQEAEDHAKALKQNKPSTPPPNELDTN